MQLFTNKSCDARQNAQQNLMGRTHYVDPDTLRWHKSRVLSARHTDDGLLFAITTSDALDMHNTKRGYRYVIFDVFGTVLGRPDLEHAFRSHEKCRKAMWAELTAINAVAHTRGAIERSLKSYEAEMARFACEVDTIEARKSGQAA